MENNNPLSPHLQIYSWHISSLVSISHRITGIINFISFILICIWASMLLLGENNYSLIEILLSSIIGKFLILFLTWSFSFQILSEIRHLIMDMGYGFELKTTRISGLLVIIGSVLSTIIIYILGKSLL